MSPVSSIREIAHFEGHLTPQEYHSVITRQISPEDIAYMHKIGYKILEFGKFNYEGFIACLKVFKLKYGHVDVPIDFVITSDMISRSRLQSSIEEEDEVMFEDIYEDFMLGELDRLYIA
jgi:hypothetical protein